MTRLLAVEWLKLRTTRLTYGLLGLAALLTGLDALLRALRAGNGRLEALDTAAGFSRPLTVTGFALLLAGILGLTISSGEFRHRTATLTYLACPDRLRVLAAKAAVGLVGGAAFGAVGAAATTGISVAVAASRGYAVAVSTGTILGDAGGAVLGGALIAAVGVALGSLLRSQIGATIGAFVWVLFVESVVGGLYGSLDPYLPFTAASTLAGARLDGGAFGFGGAGGAGAPLSFVAAGLLVAGVALAVSAVAAVTTVRQDVT